MPGDVLVPLDFGQVARLSSQDRRLLTELVLTIVERDVARMVRSLQQANILSERTNVMELIRDAEEMLDTYYNLPLMEIPLGQLIYQGFGLIRKHRIQPPAEFTLMLKALATIESLATSLDGELQIAEHLRPHARRFRLRQMDPRRMVRDLRTAIRDVGKLASKLPDDVNTIVDRLRRGQMQLRVRHEHLENLVRTLDKSSNRISFALIIAALLLGSSLLVPQEGMVLGLISLQTLGILGYMAAAVMGIWLLVSIIRSRRL